MTRFTLSPITSSAHPITRYFIKKSSGFSCSPVNMLSILGKLDQLQQNSITNQYRARIGSLVTIYDADQREETRVELVNASDARPEEGRISILSPLGAAILGLTQGEWAEVYMMGKTFHFEVRKVV